MATRRTTFALALAASGLLGLSAQAQQPDVEIAVIDSLSGPWSANGSNVVKGAELAAEEINAAGGIKALGGAKIKLIIADSAASPDDARAAAQRTLSTNPNIVAGTGAYISSQQMAITEISERAGVPWLVMGSADQLTARGLKLIFGTNMPTGQATNKIFPLMEDFVANATGGKVQDVAIVVVNTPSTVAMADGVEALLKQKGINVVAKEVFSIQLTDGSVIAQRLRRAKPQMVFFLTAIAPDTKTVLIGLNQVGITPANTPILIYGGGAFDPDMLNLMSKENLEGLTVFSTVWPTKKSAQLEARWKAKTNQPWMTFDPAYGYGHIHLIKEAVERAGSTDKAKVAEALRTMKIESGPATVALNGPVSFEPTGRRVNPPVILLQWQKGIPLAIYPAEEALAKPNKIAK